MSSASSVSLQYATHATSTAPPPRLSSLDIFRGMTIAGMLLVNNPGSGGTYDPLEHAPWNGWTPTDLIFPFFVFIMGVAIPFSLAKRSATDSKVELFLHILVRGLALFLLGELGYSIPRLPPEAPSGLQVLIPLRIFAYVFLAACFFVLLYPWKSRRLALLIPPITVIFFVAVLLAIHAFNKHALASGAAPADYNFGTGLLNPWRLRIPGVLQRLGVCYVSAASLALVAGWRAIAACVVMLLAGYAAVMLAVPYPSLKNPAEMVHGRLERDDNLARYVDEKVLGSNEHPHAWGVHSYGSYPDPEGILSTIPAIGTALLGVLAGLWLRSSRPHADKCAGILAFGVLAVILGYILDSALMPINKQLWTSSYVVLCAGLALLGLGAYFYLVDLLNFRKLFLPFTWYGMNAITAFVLAGIVARVNGMIHWNNPDDPKHAITLGGYFVNHAARLGHYLPFGDPAKNGSLAYAVGFVLCFMLIMGVLHRFKIFLKV